MAAKRALQPLLKCLRVPVQPLSQNIFSISPHLFRRFSTEEVRGCFLDKSEVTDRVISVVRNFKKVSPSKDSRNYATASGKREEKVKVPLALFGGAGNYASALYIAAVKANSLEKVESEVLDLVEAIKKSPKFAQFTKDLSVPKDTRIKAIQEISKEAKFSDITTNFLVIVAENGRLRNLDSIAKKFKDLTMAHKGEVRAIVTTVIPLPPHEEKQLKEILQEIIGAGKKVLIEEKIDPSILGGLVVEFNQKVLDASIKTRANQMERFLREPLTLGDI